MKMRAIITHSFEYETDDDNSDVEEIIARDKAIFEAEHDLVHHYIEQSKGTVQVEIIKCSGSK